MFNLLEEGKSDEEIRAELGISAGRLRRSKRLIDSILDGDLTTKRWLAERNAGRFRSILKNPTLSGDAHEVLSHNLQILENRASDTASREAETVAVQLETSRVEALAKSGIYVYTLPHYYWYPYDPDSGRTLFKVGRSNREVIVRFREQTRTTALPEDPVLLRLYEVEDSDRLVWIEKRFHKLLEAAGHDRSTARTGGTEWFLTSPEFLDEIAVTLELEIIEVDNPEDDLEDDE